MDLLKKYSGILKQKFEDEAFKVEIHALFSYYFEKCTFNLVEEDNWIINELERVFNRQFLQGYMVMSETFLENEELFDAPTDKLTYDEVFEMLPPLIKELYSSEQQDIVHVSIINDFAIDVLTKKGVSHFDILQATLEELTYYGVCYAYIHKFEEYVTRTNWMNLQTWIGSSFITPQLYMVPHGLNITNNALTFELYGWIGSIFKGEWLGQLQCNPYDKQNEFIYANIMLSDKIVSFEKETIIELLHGVLQNTLKAADNEKNIYINVFNISSVEMYSTTSNNIN